MKKREHKAIALVMVLILSGIALSFIYSESNAISKSGSLIIVVGVWFAMLDFSDVAKKAEAFTALTFITTFSGVLNKMPETSELDSESKDKLMRSIESEYKKELSEALENTKKRFIYVEAVIIIVGTLINGFGDIIQNALFCIKV